MALPTGILMSCKQYTAIKPLFTTKFKNKSSGCKPAKPPEEVCLKGKVALITGAASGIGLVIAREFLKEGVKGVTIADTDCEKGENTVLRLQSEFGPKRVCFTKTDVSSMCDFEEAFKATIKSFECFDILVNNAGMLNDREWEKTLEVNIGGVINGCILAMETYIPKHKSCDTGMVINVASIAGLEAIPTIPFYVSTKHAVVGLGKCLSAKFHYDETKTKIITICPGYYHTPLIANHIAGRTFHKRSEKVMKETMTKSDFPVQKVDILGKSIIRVIQKSKNGSFWVIDKNNVSEVHLPLIKELKKLQTINPDCDD